MCSKIKYFLSVFFSLFFLGEAFSQQVYDDFEGNAVVSYTVSRTNQIKLADNPAPDAINNSAKCAKYVRGRKKYDNIKIYPAGKLNYIEQYATYLGVPLTIRMKVFTNAPVGTMVEIQLGKKGNNKYPETINSQFQAYTTVQGAWQELEFKFAIIPEGSQVSFGEIDQITLLFDPSSTNGNTYYFDDMKGPALKEAAGQAATKR